MSVQRFFIFRLLETFFRRWWLYVLLVVPFVALGMINVLGTTATYRSTGVMQINRTTVIEAVTASNDNQGFGFDTPAVYASNRINDVLRTEAFLRDVIQRAGLTDDVENGLITADEIRRSISAVPQSDEMMTVNGYNEDPNIARALANSTIESWWAWEVKSTDEEGEATLRVLRPQLDALAAAKQNAIDVQTAYNRNLPPAGPLGAYTAEQQATITQNAQAVEDATADYNEMDGLVKAAEQKRQEADTRVRQTYFAVDAPQAPTAPESRRMKDLQTVVMFTGLGLLVSAAALVVGTLMDRSVRYGEEIETRLHVPVVATVPDSSAAIKPLVV